MGTEIEKRKRDTQLVLGLRCAGSGKTVVSDRYMAYPLSVSPVFRLDANNNPNDTDAQKRVYLYRMNTSPGLLAGDKLSMSICLEADSELCLLDQAATKVHVMPEQQAAEVNYTITVGAGATLEFLPEPLILFADAMLKQTTEITVDATAGLSLGEIVLPGRIARGEVYEFREYFSRIRVKGTDGDFWFVENMKLLGRANRFAADALFASGKISGKVLGTLLLILPEAVASAQALAQLSADIEQFSEDSFELACSVLPDERGLFVRVIAQTTREMSAGFKSALGCVRSLRNQPPLPYSL